MTNLPTGQSSITATTAPGSNPLAQAAGAGLGAYTAYSLLKPRMKEGGLVSIKKFQEGGEVGTFTDEQKFALLSAPVIGSLLQGKTAPGQSNLQALFGSVGKGVSEIPETAIAIKKLEIAGQKDKKQSTALLPITPELISQLPQSYQSTLNPRDKGYITVKQVGKQLIPTEVPTITSKAADRDAAISKAAKDSGTIDAFIALDKIEEDIDRIFKKTGNIPGQGAGAFLPDFLSSQDAKNIRNNVSILTNITLKQRSGATVTDQELERAKIELGLSLGKTDKDLMFALTNYRDRLSKASGVAFAEFDQKDMKEFYESGGSPLMSKESPFNKYMQKTNKKTSNEPFSYKLKKTDGKDVIQIQTD